MRAALFAAAVLALTLAPSTSAHEEHGTDHFFDALSPGLRAGLFDQGLFNDPEALPVPIGQVRATQATESAGSSPTGDPLRVYVVVVDGLRPQEVGDLMPTLQSLRDTGTWYEQARTVFPGETLPAHAAMMTGVLPQQNGIIANQFYRGDEPKEYMQWPEFLQADTLTTRLENATGGAVSTATVLSKQYLYGLFQGEHPGEADPHPQRKADFHWDPRSAGAGAAYVPYPSDHALDAATMGAFLDWIATEPPLPQFALVNLGDVDRAGHADEGGAALAGEADHDMPDQVTAADISPFRQVAIEDADTQIGLLVDELKQRDAWKDTVLIVLSDHGMDWGTQDQAAPIQANLTAAGFTQGQHQLASSDYTITPGGGSELLYVRDSAHIADMARVVAATDGVDFIATKEHIPGLDTPTLADLGLDHPRSPDIEAFMEAGWRSSPAPSENPLPGNHGHAITQHSALLVAGGHPLLDETVQSVGGKPVYDPEQQLFAPPADGPGALSIAPTVAGLFKIPAPDGGYPGPALTDAFDAGALDLPAPPKKQKQSGGKDKPRGKQPPAEEPAPPANPLPLLTAGLDVVRADLSSATYSVLVTNRGSAPAEGVVVTNAVPQDTTFAGSTVPPLPAETGTPCAAGATAGTTCRFGLGSLAPGASQAIELTYALAQRDGEYAVTNTVSAVGADGVATATDNDRTLNWASHVLEDAHVDDSRPGTNFGGCDHLDVRGDGQVTGFVDDDAIGTNWSGTFGGFGKQEVEKVWAAELRANAASVPAGSAPSVAAHPVRSTWNEGAGSCEGAAGSGKQARASSEAEPNAEPQAEATPVATSTVASGAVTRWDITSALVTEDDRSAFGGLELRAAAGSVPGAETVRFHSSEAASVADQPRIVAVTTWAERVFRCVDADVEAATAARDREQRVTAYVTEGGERVRNGDEDGCNGYPVPSAPIGWEVDDDSPDAFISSLEGVATTREIGSAGDVGPNKASTLGDARGASFIGVRLADPASLATDLENRFAALALVQDHDGKSAVTQGHPNEGTCEPGEGTRVFPCEGYAGLLLGPPSPGEAGVEDDVLRSWSP